MKAAIITVAGMSTRFSESVGRTCLKCIYHEGNPEKTLLYRLLDLCNTYDQLVIVGGFLFDELKQSLLLNYGRFKHKLQLIENNKYQSYGSGYSLFLGIDYLMNCGKPLEEIIFIEGDLYIDRVSFNKFISNEKSSVTYNREAIWANKAVLFYLDCNDNIHYMYDVQHDKLQIPEPFHGVFNSGQAWKFTDMALLHNVIANLTSEDIINTNLAIIQKYFGVLERARYDIIPLEKWINCNTIDDYRMIERENLWIH